MDNLFGDSFQTPLGLGKTAPQVQRLNRGKILLSKGKILPRFLVGTHEPD